MDLNFKTCSLWEIRTVFDSTAENPFDFDVTLPDYFPDIQRVLKCIVCPGITNSSLSQGRVNVEGNAILRIIYSAENKRIYCYEQTFLLNKSVDDSSLTNDMSMMATVKTDYVNCRATGQRRLSVQGVISIRFTVKERTERKIICGCDDEIVQLKSEKIELLNTVNNVVKTFSMSEVAQLGESAEPIDKILNFTSAILTDNMKAVSGKILIKGDLVTEVIYSTESDPATGISFRHTMPISQIVDVQSVSEESINDINLRVVDLLVTPKADASGNKNKLEIIARIEVNIVVDQRTETDVINDAYSMIGEFEGKFENVGFKRIADKVSDTVSVSKNFDLGSTGVSSIVSAWCNGIRYSYKIKDSDLIVNGVTSAQILYVDSDNEPFFVEKEVEFEYIKRLSGGVENIWFEPSIHISACKGVLDTENSVTFKAEIIIRGTVYSFSYNRILTDACLDTDSVSNKNAPSVIIYFAEDGEKVWDIARRYKTTANSIKVENDLIEDVLSERKMIVIPSAK